MEPIQNDDGFSAAVEAANASHAALLEDNAAAAREEAERASLKDTLFERYFYCKPRLYLYKEKSQFIPQDKDSIKRRLRKENYEESEICELILQIESKNYVPNSYPMQPARRAGAYVGDGLRYIVLHDYHFPHPVGVDGKCDTILNVLTSLFGDAQVAYFLAWIKGARRRIKACLNEGDYSTECQIMCVMGAHDIGKTNILCKRILHPLLGGGWADYGEYLKHGKQFNGELMNSCLLIADDKGKPLGHGARRRMADTMKNIGYSGSFAIEAKGKTAISVRAPWVQIVFANDDSSGLESVPDFSGMEDKFIALFAELRPTFPPNKTDEEKKDLDAAIAAELPAFAWYVDHYTPPVEIQEESGRHECKAYISPEIEKLLRSISEDSQLMNAIDMLISDPVTSDIDAICKDEGISAVTLQGYLRRRNLWKEEHGRTIGRRLTRLCEIYPDKISRRKSHGNIVYVIKRPAETTGDDELL